MLKRNLKKELIKNINDGKKFIIPYLTYGFPTLQNFKKIFLEIADNAELIEIGMPFSDPLADGKIIQKASKIALNNGANLHNLIETFYELKGKHNANLILMSYLNPCLKYGIENLIKDIKKVGFIALIFPDLPYSQKDFIKNKLKNNNINLIYLIAPTTPLERAKLIMEESNPFVYAVSVKGVTGIRKELPSELPEWLNKLKLISKTPLFVGFGISNIEHIITIKDFADGFVIGSAIIKLILDNKCNELVNFIKDIKSAI